MKVTVGLAALLPVCLHLTGCNPDSGTTAAVVKPASSAPATAATSDAGAAKAPAKPAAEGTIPGLVNIPWTSLTPAKGATTDGIMEIMTGDFGVKLAKGVDAFAVDEAIAAGDTSKVFDYSDAKTLVMFCNGMWCGQSPASIATLLKFGYPAEKMKWYRGGMQDWAILGLTTIQ